MADSQDVPSAGGLHGDTAGAEAPESSKEEECMSESGHEGLRELDSGCADVADVSEYEPDQYGMMDHNNSSEYLSIDLQPVSNKLPSLRTNAFQQEAFSRMQTNLFGVYHGQRSLLGLPRSTWFSQRPFSTLISRGSSLHQQRVPHDHDCDKRDGGAPNKAETTTWNTCTSIVEKLSGIQMGDPGTSATGHNVACKNNSSSSTNWQGGSGTGAPGRDKIGPVSASMVVSVGGVTGMGERKSASERRRDYMHESGHRRSPDLRDEKDGVFERGHSAPVINQRQGTDSGTCISVMPDIIQSSSSCSETSSSPDLVTSNSDSDLLNLDFTEFCDQQGVSAPKDSNGDLAKGEASMRANMKCRLEGRVNHPNWPSPKKKLLRQVSFSDKVDVHELSAGTCSSGSDTTNSPLAGESPCLQGHSSKDERVVLRKQANNTTGPMEGDTGGKTMADESDCTDKSKRSRASSDESQSSAVEKRTSYHTSGYGTGESSKNSTQNGSADEEHPDVFDDLPTSEVDKGQVLPGSVGLLGLKGTVPDLGAGASITNFPNLSIFNSERASTKGDGISTGNLRQVENSTMDSSSVIVSSSGFLPNLSILGSDSGSFMLSQGLISERHNSKLEYPEDIEKYLKKNAESTSDRNSASDRYALEMLNVSDYYQRSNSVPPKLLGAQVREMISPNGPRTLQRAQTVPGTDSSSLRQELIYNYSEQMLTRIAFQASEKDFEPVMNIPSGSDSISPAPYTPSSRMPGDVAITAEVGRNLADHSVGGFSLSARTFSFEVDELLPLDDRGKQVLTKLMRASRCDNDHCEDDLCEQGKQLLHVLRNSLQTSPSARTYVEHSRTLACLYVHCQQCDEDMKCPLPWCSFLGQIYQRCDLGLEDVTKRLTEFVLAPTLRFTSIADNGASFLQLSGQCSRCGPVLEGVDWMPLMRLSKFGNTVMAMNTNSPPSQYWAIKKVFLTHTEDDPRVQVYRRLTDHRSPSIVTYLWMSQLDKTLHVCSQFVLGGSIAELIHMTGPLQPNTALFYFNQILQAAAFLHSKHILYLFWKATNVVLDCNTKQIAKLCNFSTAICMDLTPELDDVIMMVPATLLSPELLEGEVNWCAQIDSWGLGWLLTEMLTGRPARHDIIHEDRKHIIDKIPYSQRLSAEKLLHHL